MKISEFIELVKDNKDLGEVNIQTYIPIHIKKKVIDFIIDNIVIIKDNMVTYNSIDKDVIFLSSALALYTELEFEDVYTDYDNLINSDILSLLFTMIGKDYNVLQDFFELRLSDKLRETNSLEAIINSGVGNLLFSIDVSLAKINQAIDKLDNNTLTKILGTLDKQIRKLTK